MDNSTTLTAAPSLFVRSSQKIKSFLLRNLSVMILILFILPFIGSMYLFTHNVNSDIRFIEKERMGLNVYQSLFKVMLTIQQLQRALYTSEVSVIENPRLIELKNKMKMLMEGVDARRNFMEEIGVLESWKETKNKLLAFMSSADYSRQNDVINSLWELMRNTVTQSNLILDPHKNTYFIINIITVIIPSLAEELSSILARINVLLSQAHKMDFNTNSFLETKGKIEEWIKLYSYSIEVLGNKGFALNQKGLYVLGDIENISMQLKDLANNSSPLAHYRALTGKITVSLETLESIYNELAQLLNSDLQQRIYNYKIYRLNMFLALAASLLVTIVIFLYARRIRIDQEELDKASCTNAILSTVADGIITINPWRIIETFNQSAERIFGYHANEVIGKNINILMPEPYHYKNELYWQQLNIDKEPEALTPAGRW